MTIPLPNLKPFGPAQSGIDLASRDLMPSVRGAAGRYASTPPDQHEQLVDQTRTWVAQTFFGTLLKQMRNSPFKSELFSGGKGGEAFGGLQDQRMAEHMARGAGSKLVNSIVRRIEANAAYRKQQQTSSSTNAVNAPERADNRTDPRRNGDAATRGGDANVNPAPTRTPRNRFTRSPDVAPQLSELEAALQQMVAEHRKLLAFVDAQQSAMRKLDLAAMDVAVNAQEACRLRIATLETKRKTLVLFLTRGQKVEGGAGRVTLTQVAALYPQRRDPLLKLGAELKQIAAQVAGRTKVAGKLAGAVLGHLNTVVRLLAGAVERAPGVYTKDGVPRVSSRIGIMEAVA